MIRIKTTKIAISTKYMEQYNERIASNPYLVKLSQHPPITNFITSQLSFIDAIDQWGIIFLKLASKSNDLEERRILIKNLFDEHGGSESTETAHVNTFKKLIHSLDQNKDIELYDQTLPTYQLTEKFYRQLHQVVESQPIPYSLAMLGMIEYIYIDVSKGIHQYLKKHLGDQNINHYSEHEILDVEHSNDLMGLLRKYFLTTENDLIKQGIERGYQLLDQLYVDMSEFL